MFSPFARINIIRLIIILAAQNQWKTNQIGVKLAFLDGNLEEEYIEQQSGYMKDLESQVYKLRKALWFEANAQSMEHQNW